MTLLAVALLATAARAQSDDPWKFDASHTVLAYATQQEAETDGPYNSGNRLARIPSGLVDVEWREDWRLTRDACNAQLDLRLLGRKTVAGGDGIAASEFSDGYARTAGIACRFGAGFEVRVGREVLQWGNATFRSPSNPFFVDTGKTHPIRELLGKDMLQLGWRSESGWAVSVVRNVGVGDRDDAPRPYRPISALRVDYVGATRSAGAIAAVRDGGRLQLGGYLTQTLSDALLVYGDAAVRQGSDGLYPVADAASPSGWRFDAVHADENRLRGSALLGAAYTFESGWSLTGEALVNNEGYNAAERAQARQAVAAGNALFLSGTPQAPLGASLLGDALQTRMQVEDRHYLFVQLLRTEWNNRADVALRWARNLDDRGSSLSGSLTYFLGERTQLLWIATVNSGPKDSEFGRLIRYSTLLGLRLRL